ncbi:hypothetical protein C8R44DRAFT_974721 [Mycena epipterygia]|nr:hypothetical protein C8R44DRAFT_974721 [Mycena epipterygia]
MRRVDGSDLVLEAVYLFDGDDEPNPNELWEIAKAELIQMNNSSSVFRATITSTCLTAPTPLDAVLKIDHTGQREQEFIKEVAEAYSDFVFKFQGDLVPRFYGSFQTHLNSKLITCTVTRYCGEPMETSLHMATAAFKTKLILAVDRLQERGASHGDMSERNILVKDGNPGLIDLEKTTRHKCERRMVMIQGVIAPTPEEFGCPELYSLIARMEFWKDPNVVFGVQYLPKWQRKTWIACSDHCGSSYCHHRGDRLHRDTQTKASMTISKASPPTTSSTAVLAASSPASASRAKHGASALIWNNTLATAVQTWVSKCTGNHSGSTLGPYDENLASGTGSFTIADCGSTKRVTEYSASNPAYSHWTQMVWTGTTNLGCAVSECNNLFDYATYGATQYHVCEYWPTGNVICQFAENINV